MIKPCSRPSTPLPPITTFVSNQINITWQAPANNGDNIIRYTILIRDFNGITYNTQLTYCNGSNPAIVAATTCSIPVSVLLASPFSLTWGTDVYVKIIATNSLGDSNESNPGHGGIIATYPDAPINISEIIYYRTSTTIALQWNNGLSTGGISIVSYQISYHI